MSDPRSTLRGGITPVDDRDPHKTAETMPRYRGGHLPLVDPCVLAALEADVDDPAIAQRFARDYAQMWEARYRRLATAFETQDRDAALDVLISLKSASTMVGGLRLAALAEHLEQTLRNGEFNDGQPLVAVVADHGNQTIQELRSTYILNDDQSEASSGFELDTQSP